MRLIDADELQERLENYRQVIIDTYGKNDEYALCLGDVLYRIEVSPTMDVVPKSAYEQVAWERDLAIMQLNDIGKGLGERMNDVMKIVRCAECVFSRTVDNREPKFQCVNICRDGCTQWVGSDDFCSYGERRADDKD